MISYDDLEVVFSINLAVMVVGIFSVRFFHDSGKNFCLENILKSKGFKNLKS